MADFAPVHPGCILVEEFIQPLSISQPQLAKTIGVSTQTIDKIVFGKCDIDAEVAILLSQALGPSPEFWLNL